MGRNTGIDWCDHSWNPWQGCKKVSPGCAKCYMFRDKKRYGQDPSIVVRSSDRTFTQPLRIKEPSTVFVCSWSDFFIEEADQWRNGVWDIIRRTPHLTYLLLTKRPERIEGNLPNDWGGPLMSNVWLGVTAENQEMADKRIPILLKIPAAVRFVSVEPMVGEVSLVAAGGLHRSNVAPLPDGILEQRLDWVICGGESGPKPREMSPHWAYQLMEECKEANVPFFMKQMTGKRPIPEMLNVRQFPEG